MCFVTSFIYVYRYSSDSDIIINPYISNWALITAISFIIANIIIDKKVDNYVGKKYINEFIKISEKINDAGYNLGISYRKLKKLKITNSHQKENSINIEQMLDTSKPTWDGLVYEAFAKEEIRQLQESPASFDLETTFELSDNIEKQADYLQQEQNVSGLTKKLISPKNTSNK